MARSSLAVIVMVALLFAGCTAGGSPAATPSPSTAPTVATITEETGGIQGIVLDTEVRPIAGATVGIVSAAETLHTSKSGEFAFSELAPGTYKVAVQALGFRSTIKAVDVIAGNITQVQFVLDPVPLEPPVPNRLTPANNVLWLHTNNAARKMWMNDTLTASEGETVHYGVNAIAFATGTGTVTFNVPADPALPESVSLDTGGLISVVLYFGGYFTGQDHGRFSVSMELRNGDTRVMAGAQKEVTMINGEGAKIQWEGAPEVDVLDKDKDLTWRISATGPSMGYSIRCSGSNVNTCERSHIMLPVI